MELFGDLTEGIWTELDGARPIDDYRRSLERTHLQASAAA